tara:strand:+ start:506 stop:916 length:411 start_codon:yes stop_codon:yes gene_type:complete
MKRLKTLCTLAGTIAVASWPSFAAEQIFDVPEYDLTNNQGSTMYYTNSKGDQIRMKHYFVDRNGDGNLDLFILEGYKPNGTLRGIAISVDDDYDLVADRELRDDVREDGTPGVDGIFNSERKSNFSFDFGEGSLFR